MTVNTSKYYIFYDGECGFCNFWVHWILKKDADDHFLFVSLQSDMGQEFLAERNLELNDLDTLYLWKPNKYYLKKSHAVLKICELLGGGYQFLSYLRHLPTAVTDFVYDRIAENRKNLATQACEIPTPEQRKKLLS